MDNKLWVLMTTFDDDLHVLHGVFTTEDKGLAAAKEQMARNPHEKWSPDTSSPEPGLHVWESPSGVALWLRADVPDELERGDDAVVEEEEDFE